MHENNLKILDDNLVHSNRLESWRDIESSFYRTQMLQMLERERSGEGDVIFDNKN